MSTRQRLMCNGELRVHVFFLLLLTQTIHARVQSAFFHSGYLLVCQIRPFFGASKNNMKIALFEDKKLAGLILKFHEVSYYSSLVLIFWHVE